MSARHPKSQLFTTTSWSLLQRAQDEDDSVRREALQQVLLRYLPAMRELLRHWGVPRDAVDDVLQEFCASKILDYGLLQKASPDRGQFRALLVAALRNFTSNERRRQKRWQSLQLTSEAGSGWQPIDKNVPDPSWLFDVIWARDVLSGALRRMQANCEAEGREDIWEVFCARWVNPWLHGTEPVPFSELAAGEGPGAVSRFYNLLVTAKRAFHRALVLELGRPQNLEEEIADLLRSLERQRLVFGGTDE